MLHTIDFGLDSWTGSRRAILIMTISYKNVKYLHNSIVNNLSFEIVNFQGHWDSPYILRK